MQQILEMKAGCMGKVEAVIPAAQSRPVGVRGRARPDDARYYTICKVVYK
jgi:hypothetical protein